MIQIQQIHNNLNHLYYQKKIQKKKNHIKNNKIKIQFYLKIYIKKKQKGVNQKIHLYKKCKMLLNRNKIII